MYIYYFIDRQEVTRSEFDRTSPQSSEVVQLIRSHKEDIELLDGSAELHYQTANGEVSLQFCEQEAFRSLLNKVLHAVPVLSY